MKFYAIFGEGIDCQVISRLSNVKGGRLSVTPSTVFYSPTIIVLKTSCMGFVSEKWGESEHLGDEEVKGRMLE